MNTKVLPEARLVFITGKGGVGKTTAAAVLARALSSQGKRVLIATSDTKDRLSRLFGVTAIGPRLRLLEPNIWAVNIEPEAALLEYGEMKLTNRILYQAVFGNRYVQSFFAAVPGLYQWAVLGKAWFHSTELESGGRPRFDAVLFDAPATGHALEMLWVPKIISEVARGGVLMRDAELAFRMLKDPRHTKVVVVTLPEEAPTSETLELIDQLRNELGLSASQLVLNKVAEVATEPAERIALAALPLEAVSTAVRPALAALQLRALVDATQEQSLERLSRESGLPVLRVPLLRRTSGLEVEGPDAIRELATALLNSLSATT